MDNATVSHHNPRQAVPDFNLVLSVLAVSSVNWNATRSILSSNGAQVSRLACLCLRVLWTSS